MRIAMIHTPFWNRAGGERQILRLAMELDKIGHEVEIFTNAVNEKSYPEFFDKVTINIIPHPLTGKLPQGITPQVAVKEISDAPTTKSEKVPSLRQYISKRVGRQYYTSEVLGMIELGRKIPKKFDIINNHNFPTEWAALIAKSRLKIPAVWMCNEPPYWFFTPEQRSGLRKINWPLFEVFDKISVRQIDEIMVLSHVSENYVRKAYDRPSRIVRTGVDFELFHETSGTEFRQKYGLENNFVILFVGGSRYAKRVDLVRALHILSKKYDSIKLIIDTSSQEQTSLTKLSEELGVKDKVILLHSKSDSDLAEIYAASDVFVYPASASPWGLVVTEAMAAAKPVIVSKQVGTSEILTDGVNGIVIESATPEEIALQVENLMNDPQLRKKIGENAYEYVKQHLSWQQYGKRVEKVFQEVLNRTNTR